MRTVIKQMRRLAKVLKDNPKKIGGGKRAGKERMKELEKMKNPPKQTKTKKSEDLGRSTKKSRKEAYETYMDDMSTQPVRKPYADDISDPRLTYEDRVELLGGKYKKGGKVKKGYHKMPDGRIMKDSAHKGMKKGGKVSSCSKRADGCAVKGKTKGRMI